MSDRAGYRRRFSDAFRGAALRSADTAYHQTRQTLSSIEERSRGLRAASEQLAGRLFRLGQRVIDRSPMPVPSLANDAFERMQDALHQLEHVIMSGDVSKLREKAAQEVRRTGTVEVRGGREGVPPLNQSREASRGKAAPRQSN